MSSAPMETATVVRVQPGKVGAISLALRCAAPGTQIVLAPGHYLENQQLTMPSALRGVHICCEGADAPDVEGPGATIQCTEDTPADAALLRIAASGVVFKNVQLLGRTTPVEQRTSPNEPARALVYIEGMSNVVFDNCVIKNAASGLCVQGSAAPTIRSSTFRDCTW